MRLRILKGDKGARRTSAGRSYASDAIKATSHPTRTQILKALREKSLSTVELEQLTGENRYNLYHHLSVLEQVGLVSFRYGESRTKEFYLRKPKRPETAYLHLDRQDAEDCDKLERLIALLRELFGDEIPNLDRVTRARILLGYPWSAKEKE